MANFLIAEPSLSDAAMDAYYASSEQAAAPASNLFLRQPKEVYESVDVASTIELRFDMGQSALPISYNFLWLGFTNASSSATITWSGSTVTNFAATAWTSGSVAMVAPGQTYYARKHAFHKTTSLKTARYVRVQISDTTNPDGVLRIGRFYCCAAYTPTLNVQFPLGFGFEDPSGEVQTTNGERHTRPLEPWPKLAFTLQANGSGAEAEFYANVHELIRRVGSSRDVVACVDVDDATYGGAKIYYGTLQQQLQIALASHQFYQAAFELKGLV